MTTTTTTNYGWTIPNDSELVKDGAAAIRTLGNAADASLKTVSDAAIAKTLIDAKGDLIAGSAADTPSKISVGADGQVLTADSTQSTGVKWATASSGGMTLLSTTSLTGASSVTISSISGSYTNLKFSIEGVYEGASDFITLTFNGNATGYSYVGSYISGSNTPAQVSAFNNTQLRIGRVGTSGTSYAAFYGSYEIPRYTSSGNKFISGSNISNVDGSTTSLNQYLSSGVWGNTSAITSMTFSNANSVNFSAGTVYLYGVK